MLAAVFCCTWIQTHCTTVTMVRSALWSYCAKGRNETNQVWYITWSFLPGSICTTSKVGVGMVVGMSRKIEFDRDKTAPLQYLWYSLSQLRSFGRAMAHPLTVLLFGGDRLWCQKVNEQFCINVFMRLKTFSLSWQSESKIVGSHLTLNYMCTVSRF